MKRATIYARVSTREQNVDMQLIDLRGYAKARGLDIIKEYIDYPSPLLSSTEISVYFYIAFISTEKLLPFGELRYQLYR
jgi:hypothetical protein